jgi:hypothetical protein
VVDLIGREPGIGEGLLRRADDAVEELGGQLGELRPRELEVEVLRPLRGRRDG